MRVQLIGLNELTTMIQGLPNVAQDRVMVAAHKEAAKPLISAAQALVPVKTGNLKRSIGSEGGFIKNAGEIGVVVIGPRRGRGGYKGYHAHLAEFGTKKRYTKSGKYTGIMPKLPFMEPAFNLTKGIVLDNLHRTMSVKFMAYMKRQLKNA